MPISHTKVSNKSDSSDSTLVRPSDWNADHTVDNLAIGTTETLPATELLHIGSDFYDYSAQYQTPIFVGQPMTHDGNEFLGVFTAHIAATGSSGDYEKAALFAYISTSDPSVGAIDRQCAGLDARGQITTGNMTGEAWGITTQAIIDAGADGSATGVEIGITNDGVDQPLIGLPTSKYGVKLFASGSNPSTAAILMGADATTWHTGIYIQPTTITSGGSAFLVEGEISIGPDGLVSFLSGTSGLDASTAGGLGVNLGSAAFPELHVFNTSGGAGGPNLKLSQISASPAAGDQVCSIEASGRDSAANTQRYGLMAVTVDDPTSGSEDSHWDFYDYIGGTQSLEMTVGTGVRVGNPTGGGKGLGSINVAADIYKNNLAYTNPDYALEAYFTGDISKFAENEGANSYRGLIPIDDLEARLRYDLHLPGISTGPMGAFARSDIALEKIEEAWLYICQLHNRIKVLEQKLEDK